METRNEYSPKAIVRIRKGQGRSLKAGGAWIYDNEIESINGAFENGDMVTVEDFDGYPLGTGYINTRSRLTVRMMSRRKDTVIDSDFLEMRVRNAWDYRKAVTDTSSCRVIFGEADFLPGIVIDKFSDVLVVESLALGIDRLKPVIVDKLRKVMAEDGIAIRGVYERSDAKVRLQEGMERHKGFIGDAFDTKVEILENGSVIWWMWRTVRKQASSWTRSTTGWLFRISAAASNRNRCWTALPTPVPLPSTPGWQGPLMCWAWMPRSWR